MVMQADIQDTHDDRNFREMNKEDIIQISELKETANKWLIPKKEKR